MQNRPDSEYAPGGDTVQMHRTEEALRQASHDGSISFEPAPDLGCFYIVHLFNLTRPIETSAQAENARRHGKPYVLSSVYWDLDAAVPWSAHGLGEGWRLRLGFLRGRIRARI